jgi:hypothetical protein
LLLEAPGVARYLAQDGQTLSIESLPGAVESQVRHFARLTPLAALLFQRGMLALHAAAALPPGQSQGAILLAGDSSTGKSTLLAALLKRGWRMLADELAILTLNAAGQPVLIPNPSEIRLWPDAIKKLAWDASLAAESPHTQGAGSEITLGCLYALRIKGLNPAESTPVPGAQGFRLLGGLTYNSHIADALLDRTAYFRLASAVLQCAPVLWLQRPRDVWSVDDLVEILETRPAKAMEKA